MAQHDYQISNGSGIAVRNDVNNALAAIVTQNAGPAAPSPSYPYMWWADTVTGKLRQRNAANTAWIDHGLMSEAILRSGVIASGGTAGLLRKDGDGSDLSGVSVDVQAAIDEAIASQSGFTIIYPNGGSAVSPANISVNARLVEANPFSGSRILCVAEIYVSGKWIVTGWYNASGGGLGSGVVASQLDNEVIVQAGQYSLLAQANASGGNSGYAGGYLTTPTPCRVLVYKMQGSVPV